MASYYDVVIDDKVNRDAAWYYPNPSPAADRIKDRVAFWHGVKVDQVDACHSVTIRGLDPQPTSTSGVSQRGEPTASPDPKP